ncbi:MAG: hypothetical protein WED81_05270, partial [Rhodothermales bacterium]
MTRVSLVLVLVSHAALAQVNSGGPRAAAMAGAAAALIGDTHAEANPAAWAGISTRSLSLSASQLYGLRQLRFAQAIVVLPGFGGITAASATTFGYDDYRETTASLGYARSLRAGSVRRIAFGVRLRWYSVTIHGYGSASVPTVSAGIILPVMPAFTIGLAASNLYVLPLDLSRDVERSIQVGAAFRATSRLLVAVDARKSTTSPADFLFGLELRPSPAFALRGGFTTDPARFTAGAGIRSATF